jgi:hypothetical protein
MSIRLDPNRRIHRSANSRLKMEEAMKYLMMIKHAEGAPGLEHPQALYQAMGQFVEESMKSGVLKDTAGLKRTEHGYRIRSKGGKLTRTDGPFAESKEIVGGYAIVEARTREEAEALARTFMELHREHVPDFECECEVRPLEEY